MVLQKRGKKFYFYKADHIYELVVFSTAKNISKWTCILSSVNFHFIPLRSYITSFLGLDNIYSGLICGHIVKHRKITVSYNTMLSAM